MTAGWADLDALSGTDGGELGDESGNHRGYFVTVTTDAGRRVELYVSEAGRVIRIRADGKTRWTVLGASDD